MLPLGFSPAAFPVCTVAARFASPSFHCSAGRKIDCLIILFPPFAGPSPPGAASPGPARRTATRTPTATGGANRAALRQVETAAAAQGAEAAAAAGSAAAAERGRSTTTGGQGISTEKTVYLLFGCLLMRQCFSGPVLPPTTVTTTAAEAEGEEEEGAVGSATGGRAARGGPTPGHPACPRPGRARSTTSEKD